MTKNEEKKADKSWLEINRKHVIATLGVILATIVLEIILLRTLSVYRTGIGTFLLAKDLIIQLALLLLISGFSLAIAEGFKSKIAWWVYHFCISIICILSFADFLNGGLALDVDYTWVLNKAGYNLLNLQYLNGWTIIFVFILTALFFLSDPRFPVLKGKDGKMHRYAHSKVVGLVRMFDRRYVGDNPDYPIIAAEIKEKLVPAGSIYRNDRVEKVPVGVHFNDLVRVKSKAFALWLTAKFIIGISVSSLIVDGIVTRYLTIREYLGNAGIGWHDLAGNYLSIFWMRLTGTVNVPLDFAITNAVTFEFGRLFTELLGWFAFIWGLRLIIATGGEIITCLEVSKGSDKSISHRNTLINASAIIALVTGYNLATVPMKVFTAATPYHVWQNAIVLVLAIALIKLLQHWDKIAPSKSPMDVDTLKEWFASEPMKRGIRVAVFVLLMLSPSIIGWLFVETSIDVRQKEYVWDPATRPSIEYTRWAYQVDDVVRLNVSAIVAPSESEILTDTRVFNKDAALLNMRSTAASGVNWMAISDASIIRPKDSEYWVASLVPVRPPYQNDRDIKRSERMIITHSENVMAIDAASSKPATLKDIFGIEETPQLYYGVGGLWSSVPEVYLDIAGFPETHLPNYKGPAAYNDRPDYVYAGFWRAWKFYSLTDTGFWQFAGGKYGDIKTLVQRDTDKRLSKILLPGLNKETSYMVSGGNVSDGKNLYSLYWVWISRESPSEFADYPDNTENQILRLFAVVLVNNKNGEFDGYLMNTERDDYVLSFYRTFYSKWNKPVPEWLWPQIRRPEQFMNNQIRVYNVFFQEDFQKWQQNSFYEPTVDMAGNLMEEVRYILMPLFGNITWAAERIVELHGGNSRNLAGMYVAPSGKDMKLYFVDFEGRTIIGPSSALSNIVQNTRLTTHPDFKNWESGNVLFYSLDRLYYVVPYYKKDSNNLLPQAVAMVDALDQTVGFHRMKNPRDSNEVGMAATYAWQDLARARASNATDLPPEIGNAISVNGNEMVIQGTVVGVYPYTENGNSRWLIDIRTQNASEEILGKAEMLNRKDVSKIVRLKVNDLTTVSVDKDKVIVRIEEVTTK